MTAQVANGAGVLSVRKRPRLLICNKGGDSEDRRGWRASKVQLEAPASVTTYRL